MPFWLRYDNGAGLVETPLAVNPTEVEYPDERAVKVQTTQDGATVVQRPLRDGRARRLWWRNLPASLASFAPQWALLSSLDARVRGKAGLPVLVELWEDVSGHDGFARTDANGNRIYTRVKVTQTNRAPIKGGGSIIYDHAVEFYVVDDSYTSF